MPSAVASVIVAAASAVGKVFVIGVIGFLSVKYPRSAPLLPIKGMSMLARVSFNLLLLPLIYSTIASTVTPDALGSFWFVLVSAVAVISVSYAVATGLGWLPYFKFDAVDFNALRVAASFPNIVALPILIFPTLCEYEVVHEAFYDDEVATRDQMYRHCVDQSNSMVFVYFFGWSFMFWLLGNRRLVNAAAKKEAAAETTEQRREGERFDNETSSGTALSNCDNTNDQRAQQQEETRLQVLLAAIKQTTTSAGFIAMVLGFITACIPPLQEALFSTGGALRFLGGALESLGSASASVGTLVVAASLHDCTEDEVGNDNDDGCATEGMSDELGDNALCIEKAPESPSESVDIMDLNAKRARRPYRRDSLQRFGSIVLQRSSVMLQAAKRSPTVRMHTWFFLSRLVVTPALICAALIGMDCGGALTNVPNLAKLVILLNSSLPGALMIVVILKSNGLSGTASIVAGVYLPSYVLSVVTIAAWTTVGLLISVPQDDGTSFCGR